MKTCPSCGEENPPRFRLCGFCGTPLDAPTSPTEIRKTVSIVFCDLKGSTDLAERLDTESVREVLSLYFSEMRACIERHGGTVEKYIGDAIMAVFGLPRTHEDDAMRAVRAAADMRDILGAVNERIEAGWGVRLVNRTGVNTGEVVATGDIVSRERLVAGDTVNVAARLEQAAGDNEILIGKPTYDLVKDAVDVQPMDPLPLKGKSEPVPAYRLISTSLAEGVARRVDTPIVGRVAELATLHATLADAIASRDCRVVTVIGPAGAGKSRLMAEFVAGSSGHARALRGRCLPYGDGITFWPLAEIARKAAGISDEDSLEDASAKLAAVTGPGATDVVARLSGAIGLSQEAFSVSETFWAARRFLEILARREPLVVVIDDIHWAEETFLELIRFVLATASDAPIVVACTARGDLLEDHPDWSDSRPGTVTLDLQPLTDDESTLVVSNLLGDAELDDDVRARIVAAAEGNPLFVEQLLGMLIDDGSLARGPSGRWVATSDLGSLQLPPTIAALLVARLDRLPEPERVVMERGSVIGQLFFRAAVIELSPDGLKDHIDESLERLMRKELVSPGESAFAGDAAFRFTHILIRDAAYHGLLKRTRADLHERFVDWLERHTSDRVTEYEEIRGYHLEQALVILTQLGPVDDHGRQVGARGSRYLASAGHRALARGDMHAAASLLRRAAGMLSEDDEARSLLLLSAGEALVELGDFALADSILAGALDRAAAASDEGLMITASLARLHLLYVTQAVHDDRDITLEVEPVIPRLEELRDHRGLARAWRLLTYVHWNACRWGEAEIAAMRAMEHADLAGDHRMGTGFVASLATCALYGPDTVSQAIDRCENLLLRAGGDGKAEALILRAMSQLEAMRGSFDPARELYRRSRAMLEELGWNVLAALTSLVSGPVEMLAGDPVAAEAELRRDYASLDEMGERNYISTTAGFLAGALYDQDRLEEAERYASICRDLAATDDVSSQVLWRSVSARVLAATGRLGEAESLAREALALIVTSDEPDSHAAAWLDLAEILVRAGKGEDAAAAAAAAEGLFTDKGNIVGAARAATLVERLNPRVKA